MSDDNKITGFWQTVPGILTAIAGIITAVAGLLLALYQAGFLGGTKSIPSNANPASVASTTNTTSVATPRGDDSSTPINRGSVQVNISGTWQDTDGAVYEFVQEGNTFKGRARWQGIVSEGMGTFVGREYTSTFSTNRPSSGQCKGIIAVDGNMITSTCWDSAIGYFSTTMYRNR